MIKLLSMFIILFGCTQFVQNTDDEYFETYSQDGKDQKLNLLFSHNIHGETHPCGCRKFPRGGIPQIYGAIHKELGKEKYLYVDTGDTFFPSSVIPESIKESSRYTANKLAEAMDNFGLKIFVPGSFDFALGEEFLIELSNKHKFSFLISNADERLKIKHKELLRVKYGEVNLFFIGIVNPEIIHDKHKYLFSDPIKALKKKIAEIEKLKDVQNKKIVLLSHSGMEFDIEVAKQFDNLPWIIGSHTQAFLKETRDINKSKIVQVLSRNHHLGLIKISPNLKGKDEYKLLSVDEDLKDAIKPNPYISWLENYKTELDKIQEKEQSLTTTTVSDTKYPTYSTCLDCHDKQVEFWQSTSHALGLKTLIDAKASNNPQCIGCHSLGFQDEKGFSSAKTIVTSEKENFKLSEYWKDFSKALPFKSSVRELSSVDRLKYAKKWIEVDTKHEIVENNGNIQCLHCHDKNSEHPFDESTPKKKIDYQARCTQCHTTDQSPEWYNKGDNGLAKDLNQKYFEQKLKSVSCPKIETE